MTQLTTNLRIKSTENIKLNQQVSFPSVDCCPFIVKGIMEDELYIEGDFSGGTQNITQKSWIKISELYYIPSISDYSDLVSTLQLIKEQFDSDIMESMGTRDHLIYEEISIILNRSI